MSNPFIDFQNEVETVKSRWANGEINAAERDAILREMRLQDETWGDTWMLNAEGQWFRQAKGSDSWAGDYPIVLIEPETLPTTIATMNLPQIGRAVHDCTRCPLHEGRTRPVPGEGSPTADLMLIGEGPGFQEDRQARPFVGTSGKLLTQLLNDIGYRRQDVFISNMVRCRPPHNRDPKPDEIAACQDYLERQIDLINPKVLVTLGRFSMNRYFPGASISKIHGQPQRFGQRLVVPMFHPAAALYQPRWRPLLEADFAKLPDYVNEAATFITETDLNNAEQLNLF